jgi:hypothetical protein
MTLRTLRMMISGALVAGALTTTPALAAPDVLAIEACAGWVRVVADSRAGILADGELRPRIQAIHKDARLSNHGALQAASTRMLRAITIPGNGVTSAQRAEMKAAMQGMAAICGT